MNGPMETPASYNITLPVETPQGWKIHKFDYREGYVWYCALCDGSNEDHENRDHAFVREPEENPVSCPHCGMTIDRDYHYGVYVSRVSYLGFDRAFCAYEFDYSSFPRDPRCPACHLSAEDRLLRAIFAEEAPHCETCTEYDK